MNENAELVFFKQWLRSPMRVASVTPSSSQLARAMASAMPDHDGLVVELGGGTGPITQALLNAGVRPEQLIVIERDPHFHRHLVRRFPGVAVLLGDAFEMRQLVGRLDREAPIRAVVSGLPLLPLGAAEQRRLLQQSLLLTGGTGPLIQFSYGLTSPLQKKVELALGLRSHCVAHVWRNIPPAKVWRYERQAPPEVLHG